MELISLMGAHEKSGLGGEMTKTNTKGGMMLETPLSLLGNQGSHKCYQDPDARELFLPRLLIKLSWVISN